MITITRFALTIGAAVLFAGCDSAQTRATFPSEAVSGSARVSIRGDADRLMPGGRNKDLLYVSLPSLNAVYVFELPQGALIGELTGFDDPTGLCSDSRGDVWISNADNSKGNGTLVEYAHGGNKPIATLSDPNNAPEGCSVDLVTGNLAVADTPVSAKPNIAVYANATGPPTYYPTRTFVKKVTAITYNTLGDLYFADTSGHFAWLPAGGKKVANFKLGLGPKANKGIEWDGLELAVLTEHKGQEQIWRYKVTGGSGERGEVVTLKGASGLSQFAIAGTTLASPGSLGVWLYDWPKGGPSVDLIKAALGGYGIAISPAK